MPDNIDSKAESIEEIAMRIKEATEAYGANLMPVDLTECDLSETLDQQPLPVRERPMTWKAYRIDDAGGFEIHYPDGVVRGMPGDYIFEDEYGKRYVVSADIMKKNYYVVQKKA